MCLEIAASGYSKLQMLLTHAGTHSSLGSSTTMKLFEHGEQTSYNGVHEVYYTQDLCVMALFPY